MSRVLRAGAIMAAGTLASRITGLGRTIILASAIGVASLGDAYNVAYTVPFVLFDLLMGGVLSSVIVPMIVRARKLDDDGGLAYEQRLLTLVTFVLGVVSIATVLLAEPLIGIYATGWSQHTTEVSVTLARFILPQIAFFGVGALAGAMLNTRDRFAAPMWAPVLNNLVVIGVGITYLVISKAGRNIDKVTDSDLMLLGLGTTAGILAQSVLLVISLRRAGFNFRPRFDLHNLRLGELGRSAVWTLTYVAITQIGYALTTNLATKAGEISKEIGVPYGAGITPYSYAFMLFQLPYGIIAVSVTTAMLPRMSQHAADERIDSLREEFSSGVQLVSAVLVPSGLLLAVLGPALSLLIFARGAVSTADAIYIGQILQVFGLALVPFSLFQMLLRVFYSLGDTRTPAFLALGIAAFNAVLGLASFFFFPPGYAVIGLALAFAVSYTAGMAATWLLASRRVGGLHGSRVFTVLTRMYCAAIPGGLVALGMLWLTQALTDLTTLSAITMLVIGGGCSMALYLVIAHRMRIAQISSIVEGIAERMVRQSRTK
ncbi:murein biosynthesis integral membrane protein MurJ [Streptosporangium saharense]|uniref:murein biosynthesis integral membrane protein MurJ n=1 Tax=Streptosporangium saharense TaxID=1706840 RepID=UPI0036B4B04C